MFGFYKRVIAVAIGLIVTLGLAISTAQAKPMPLTNALFLAMDSSSHSSLELHAIDPVTLQDIAGYEPLPMGRFYTAVLSKDRKTLAAVIWPGDSPINGAIHLIDLERWEDRKTTVTIDAEVNALTFSADEKTLYWTQEPEQGYRSSRAWGIFSYSIQHDGGAVGIAKLPVDLMPQQMRVLKSGSQLAIFAMPEGDNVSKNMFSQVVIVDLQEKHAVANIKLDGLDAGMRLLQGSGNGSDMIHEYNQPGLAWNLDANLLYIAHPTADRLTVVDLAKQTIAQQVDLPSVKVAGHAKMMKGTSHNAILNPAGDRLYISTYHSDVIAGSDGNLTETMQPLGIKMIDVEQMKTAQQVSLPVYEMALSPNGDRLLATGTDSQIPFKGDGKVTNSGLYILDASSLQTLKHFDTENKQVYLYGFSPDGRYAYFSVDPYSYGGKLPALHVVDLQSLETGAERTIPRGYIDIFGTLNMTN
jgi:WD40 repeat protein